VSRDVFPAVEPESTVYAPLQALRQAIFPDPALTPDGVARVRAEHDQAEEVVDAGELGLVGHGVVQHDADRRGTAYRRGEHLAQLVTGAPATRYHEPSPTAPSSAWA
jgi:hypothetical protein